MDSPLEAPAKKPTAAVKKILDDCCEQMAQLTDARKDLNADLKDLKKRIEETMLAARVPEWNHAGVELSIVEGVKIKPPAAKKEDDE